jgi:hypothetical protein
MQIRRSRLQVPPFFIVPFPLTLNILLVSEAYIFGDIEVSSLEGIMNVKSIRSLKPSLTLNYSHSFGSITRAEWKLFFRLWSQKYYQCFLASTVAS